MAISFATDIRPLFRQRDVQAMRINGGFNLSRYEDVSARADAIHGRLQDGSMPCDMAWPQSQIDLFAQWIVDGKLP
ncbi:MAG: hypothetical protein EOO77_45840 [Oxalobacteraceae bacterium]|nr:MAG: hypothetical protein EOO77_45840 [Oxalobacteraceae bacterium]